jgi:hypothetical protein
MGTFLSHKRGHFDAGSPLARQTGGLETAAKPCEYPGIGSPEQFHQSIHNKLIINNFSWILADRPEKIP